MFASNIVVTCILYLCIFDLSVAHTDRTNNVLHNIHKRFLANQDNNTEHSKEQHFCCTPNKWEAMAFMSTGELFINAVTVYTYINGSGRVAYDKTAGKSYIAFNISEFTPLAPGEEGHDSMTYILDTVKGLEYNIDTKGACNKKNITKSPLSFCIPRSGKFLSRGQIGSIGANVYTYQFQQDIQGSPVQTTATVSIDPYGHCLPVTMSMLVGSVGFGFLYNFDVHDLTYTIQDDSVFTPPPACN